MDKKTIIMSIISVLTSVIVAAGMCFFAGNIATAQLVNANTNEPPEPSQDIENPNSGGSSSEQTTLNASRTSIVTGGSSAPTGSGSSTNKNSNANTNSSTNKNSNSNASSNANSNENVNTNTNASNANIRSNSNSNINTNEGGDETEEPEEQEQPNLNVLPLQPSQWTSFNSPSFAHGDKLRENQKYIILHDSGNESEPLSVAQGWVSQDFGNWASHFVIGRNGNVVQCADIDTITHHAGWGGPGDYDSQFGVGNDDGQGVNDDLVNVVPEDGYTSYGMNSYSIGICLVHAPGTDYTPEQLISLNRLIRYLDDQYDGNAGEIISQKEWNTNSGDMDANFDQYLENYKTIRQYAPQE